MSLDHHPSPLPACAAGHGREPRAVLAARAVPPASAPSPLADLTSSVADTVLGAVAPAIVKGHHCHGNGLFDRMFQLPALASRQAPRALAEFAAVLLDPLYKTPAGDSNIPAGYTYLGQFIDHDLTLDLTPLSAQVADPDMRRNFRTPGLDLDSLYGTGPGSHRFLYERGRPAFLIGTTHPALNVDGTMLPALPNDLPRRTDGVALIADHRNDENVIVAQLHVALLKFHNKVLDRALQGGTAHEDAFNEASQSVRWHYQWIVVHDFLRRVTQPGTVEEVLKKRVLYPHATFMPVEFSGAAFRFGHSMVRFEYSYNRAFRPREPKVGRAQLGNLFDQTNLSGNIPDPKTPEVPATLPSNWVIDWRRFFDFKTPASTPDFESNMSRQIRPALNPKMLALPKMSGSGGFGGILPFRNLTRGYDLSLPSGQAVAEHMATLTSVTPLTPDELSDGRDGEAAKKHGFHLDTPLWYYLLKEAEMRAHGCHLGPIGSRIVAEVLIGLLQDDENSFLSAGWTPTLPSAEPGSFTMADLLEFVGDVSPLDGIATTGTL